MKLFTHILYLFLLSGCGIIEENGGALYSWSGKVTEESSSFILSYNEALFGKPQMFKIERWWTETQMCMGMSFNITNRKLIIEYVPTHLISPYNGYISWYNRYIRVIESDLWIDGYITKHKMVHYILYLMGLSDSNNEDHNSTMFAYCG